MEEEKTNTLLTISNYFWTFLNIINIFLCFVVCSGPFFFKKRRTIEDKTVISKKMTQLIFFSYILIIAFGAHLFNYFHTSNLFLMQYFLPCFLAINYAYSCYGMNEQLLSKVDPTYVFKAYINSSRHVIYEISIVLISICLILSEYFNLFEENEIVLNFSLCLLFSNNMFLILVLWCFVITSWIIIIRDMRVIRFLDNNTKAKKRTIGNFTVVIFQTITLIVYSFCYFYLKTDSIDSSQSIENSPTLFCLLIVLNFLIILMFTYENIIDLVCLYDSDFFYFSLGETFVGSFLSLFGTKSPYKRPLVILDNATYVLTNKEVSMNYIHSSLNYYVEDHIIHNFDKVLNISLASLYLIYDNPEFQSSEQENHLNSLQMINNFKDFSKTSLLDRAFYINTKMFSFTKNDLKNDFKTEKLEKLIQSNDSIFIMKPNLYPDNYEIQIESHYHYYFLEILKEKSIDFEKLKASLISHIINPTGAINSLIAKNCTEAYFKTQTTLTVKTFDKHYSLEFLNESLENSDFIKNYLKHMVKNKHSFLPLIIGAYSIRINKFNKINFLLIRNTIIDESPKEYFSYWQLMKLSLDKIEMITSSKDRLSLMLTDDVILNSNQRLIIHNYDYFNSVIHNDFKFLRKNKIKDFSLLVMYYETGVNRTSGIYGIEEEKLPAQQQGKFNNNVGMNNRISLISRNFSVIKGKSGNESSSNKKENENNIDSTFEVLQGLDFDILNNVKGFEATINNFRCVLFFVFDNIFHERSLFESKSYYDKFMERLRERFDEGSILEE